MVANILMMSANIVRLVNEFHIVVVVISIVITYIIILISNLFFSIFLVFLHLPTVVDFNPFITIIPHPGSADHDSTRLIVQRSILLCSS